MGETVIRKPSLKLPGRAARRATTAAAQVETGYLRPDLRLPLVYSPCAPDLEPAGWATLDRASMEGELLRHGAVLFRGFDVASPAHFERFAAAFCSALLNENGEPPRRSVSGNVYTPVFYP